MRPWERHLVRLAAVAVIAATLGLGVWGIVDWYIWRAQVTSVINQLVAPKAPSK